MVLGYAVEGLEPEENWFGPNPWSEVPTPKLAPAGSNAA
jgi:hypothetical protein